MKLVATDLDGAFLDDNGNFDGDRLHYILDKFLERDILFIAASGRSLLALEKIFSDYKAKMGFIAENGTLVKVGDDIIYESYLKKEQYLEIIDTLTESPYMNGYDFLLSGTKGAYVHPDASPSYVSFISNYYEKVQRVSSLASVTDTILKITANFSEETVRLGEAWFNERIDYAAAVTTGFKSVDIVIRDVNKRTGLESLCEKYGIVTSDILAFGDNLNDYEMLEFAGTAVATQNARVEIKEISDYVIGHCDDGAVMDYMEGIVK